MTITERLNVALNILTDTQEYSWDWTGRATNSGDSMYHGVIALDAECVKGKEKVSWDLNLWRTQIVLLSFSQDNLMQLAQLRDSRTFVECLLMYMNCLGGTI